MAYKNSQQPSQYGGYQRQFQSQRPSYGGNFGGYRGRQDFQRQGYRPPSYGGYQPRTNPYGQMMQQNRTASPYREPGRPIQRPSYSPQGQQGKNAGMPAQWQPIISQIQQQFGKNTGAPAQPTGIAPQPQVTGSPNSVEQWRQKMQAMPAAPAPAPTPAPAPVAPPAYVESKPWQYMGGGA